LGENLAASRAIRSTEELGAAVRRHRRSRKLTQETVASLSNVSIGFLSDFENGKPTAEIGKILQTVVAIGLELFVRPRGARTAVGGAE
jgi:transcriptional regulator with XRE-family HTH domain